MLAVVHTIISYIQSTEVLYSQSLHETHSISKYAIAPHILYVSLLIVYQILLTGYGPARVARFFFSVYLF